MIALDTKDIHRICRAVRKPFFFQSSSEDLPAVLLFGAREGRVDGNLNLSEPRQLVGVNLQFSLHGRSAVQFNRDIFPRVYTLRSREICRAEQSKTCIYCILFNNARAKKTQLLSKTAQGLEQSGICFTRGRRCLLKDSELTEL